MGIRPRGDGVRVVAAVSELVGGERWPLVLGAPFGLRAAFGEVWVDDDVASMS